MFVQAKNICKSYGEKLVLRPLTFDVHGGEILGLIGANGGGKTTVLRMIAGAVHASGGAIRVHGRELPVGAREIRANIGYMAQNLALYDDLTVMENLKFRASIYELPEPKRAVEQIVEEFELSKYAAVRAGKLSGGWGRMLQLAAAVIHKPGLLLLDEPTSGLDAAARHQVWRYIEKFVSSDTAVVVSTHDLNEAMRCTNTLFLAQGSLLAKGTPKDIIREAGCAAFIVENDNLASFSGTVTKKNSFYSMTRENDVVRLVVSMDTAKGLRETAELSGASIREVSATLTDASAKLLYRAVYDTAKSII